MTCSAKDDGIRLYDRKKRKGALHESITYMLVLVLLLLMLLPFVLLLLPFMLLLLLSLLWLLWFWSWLKRKGTEKDIL